MTLAAAERAEPPDRWALICFAAGREIAVDPDELHGALRRAMLLLAAGGDPRRPLTPDSRAVAALADDLDTSASRDQLAEGLAGLASDTERLPHVAEALDVLSGDSDLAWRCYAMALLAAELADDD